MLKTYFISGCRNLSLALLLFVGASQGALYAANNAQFVSQSVPATMTAGQTYNVSVTLKNSGTSTWTKAAAFKLGSQNPQDNVAWLGSSTRVYLADADAIAPGQTKTFSFAARAPSAVGTYNFQWKMVQEGVEWFGGLTGNIAVAVNLPAPPPAGLSPDGTAFPHTATSVTLAWDAVSGAVKYNVRATDNEDPVLRDPRNNCPGNPHYLCMDGVTAASISLPVRAGHSYDWWVHAVNASGISSDPGAAKFTVQSVSNNAQFVSQSVPASMTTGQSYSVSLTVKNTGNTTWTKATDYALGTQNPQDNLTWLGSSSRVSLADADAIAPGQTKTFSFAVRAPSAVGTYNFQWKMVRDFVEWFGPLSTNVSIVVQSPADTVPPSVSITAPAAGAAVSGQLSVTAAASDNVGVARVELYADGALKATDSAAPYSFTLDTALLSNGAHSLQAKAYDAAGNAGAGPAVSVTISNMSGGGCPGLSTFINRSDDASAVLQTCISQAAAGATLEIPAGVYTLNRQVQIGRAITIKTLGKSVSDAKCQLQDNSGCVELKAGVAFDAGSSRGILAVTAPGVTFDHLVINGNRLERALSASVAACQAGNNGAGINLHVAASNFIFTNSVSKYAVCGAGLEHAVASGGRITSNTFAYNGVHDKDMLWADGLTIHSLDNSTVSDNEFVDNTDVDLILGGCRNCLIQRNVIRHSGSFPESSFAGFMAHAWPSTSGDYTGSDISGNKVDCGSGHSCGFGFLIGGEPWYSVDTYGGVFHDNSVANAQQGFAVSRARDISVYNNSVSGSGGEFSASCGKRTATAYSISPTSRNIDRSKDSTSPAYAAIDWSGCIFNWWNIPDPSVSNGASFVSQSVPATMTSGQTYNVSVTFKNSGTSTWTKAAAFKLGSQNPQDNAVWLDVNRVELGSTDSIAPNQTKTFVFTVKAPVAVGTYNFQWKMVREGAEWFGGESLNVDVVVAKPEIISKSGAATTVGTTGFGNNSVAFWQIPGQPDMFAGRVSQSATSWSLAVGRMNWNTNTISNLRPILTPPVAIPQGRTITTAYDPSIAFFNNEFWAAFECHGTGFDGSAAACMGPLDINGAIDTARTYIAVLGNSSRSDGMIHSASVPKLLNYQNRLYLYWTAVNIDATPPNNWKNITSWGVELEQEPGPLKRLWAKGAGGPIPSNDPRAVEVWGLGTDDRSDTVADVFQVFTDGRYVYATAARGGRGSGGSDLCLTPLNPSGGCYRLSVSRASSPLGLHIFNQDIAADGQLPSNPHEYGRIIVLPDGSSRIMGQFLPAGSAQRDARSIAAGFQSLPIPGGSLASLFSSSPVLREKVLAVRSVAVDVATLIKSTSTAERPLSVNIPAASFAREVTLSLMVPDSMPPAGEDDSGLKATGIGLEISLDQAVQPAKAATIEITYTDDEVAGLDRSALVIARYDEEFKTWVSLESVSYPGENKVVGTTNHFSLFQVMVLTAGVNLNSARIYPNPFYPNRGHTQLTMDGVPEGTVIKVYTLNGELVWSGKAGATGAAVWDGRNKAGRKGASGLYLVRFQHNGKTKIKKVSIIR